MTDKHLNGVTKYYGTLSIGVGYIDIDDAAVLSKETT